MYVRAAKNRDELWLLDNIDALGVDETAFRSRDYVIAVDEETNEKAGFGRIRLHKYGGDEYVEITSLGILDAWRDQGVGAHLIERLVENVSDQGFEEVFAFVDDVPEFEQFGFEPVDEEDLPAPMRDRVAEKRQQVVPEAQPMLLRIAAFTMPSELREAFKRAGGEAGDPADEIEETPEDFGIDPDTATYKYDTGR